MNFFDSLRKKLRRKNLLRGILYSLILCILIALIVYIGFSSDSALRFGTTGSSIPGNGIPSWLVSGILAIIALLLAAATWASFSAFSKATDYQKLLAEVEKLGEPASIGKELSATKKSPHIKGGELRYNKNILFYRQGTEIHILPLSSITNIKAEIEKRNKAEEYYVSVQCKDQTLKIQTTKKNLFSLAEDLQKTLDKA